jgi:hypothetical protein
MLCRNIIAWRCGGPVKPTVPGGKSAVVMSLAVAVTVGSSTLAGDAHATAGDGPSLMSKPHAAMPIAA